MNRTCYVIYRRAWSIAHRAELEMRLEYERTWVPDLGVWRDFLLKCDALDHLPTAA